MVGDDPPWRTAVENPKATILGLLFALTIALTAFGVTVDLLGSGVPVGPFGGNAGP